MKKDDVLKGPVNCTKTIWEEYVAAVCLVRKLRKTGSAANKKR